MKKIQELPATIRSISALVLLVLGGLLSSEVLAEERDKSERHQQHEQHAESGKHMEREAVRPVERVEHGEDHYRSPHWELDTRFRHNYYYPRRGSIVSALPPSYFSITFGGSYFYFQGGVWFRNAGVNFVVTLPPAGIITPVLPPTYTTVWIGSAPYYYANGVYYAQAVSVPGYVVVEPPSGADNAIVQPAPGIPPAPSNTAVVNIEPLFVYPRNGQTEALILTDRNECNRWATGQTGYDPADGMADAQRRSNFQRAVSSCLEGRGYTVR